MHSILLRSTNRRSQFSSSVVGGEAAALFLRSPFPLLRSHREYPLFTLLIFNIRLPQGTLR